MVDIDRLHQVAMDVEARQSAYTEQMEALQVDTAFQPEVP